MVLENVNKIYLNTFILLGTLSFMINGTGVLRLAATILTIAAVIGFSRKYILVMSPFTAGMISFFSRLSYWDSFEYADRVSLLFYACTSASLLLFFHIYRDNIRGTVKIFESLSVKKRAALILLACQLILLIPALTISDTPGKTIGDEPYYLVLGQSLAEDGDFNIFNQHYRGRFKTIVKRDELKPHGHFGKGSKKLYSTHMAGMPLTLVPLLKSGIKDISLLHKLIRVYLSFSGAILATLIYLFGTRLFKNQKTALTATLIFLITSPVFFMSVHIFPEVQATLMIFTALYLLLWSDRTVSKVFAGLLLGAVVFWGVKYLIPAVLYSIGFLFWYLKKRDWKSSVTLILSGSLFLILFFWYLNFCYGSFSVNSIYFGVLEGAKSREFSELIRSIPNSLRFETLTAYFIDQRDGLLPYNLFYLLAFPGFIITIVKTGGRSREFLLSIPPIIYILYHGATTFRAGDCPQGRFLIPLIPFMLLFSFRTIETLTGRAGKLVPSILAIYSIIISLIQLFSPHTLYQPATHEFTTPMGLIFQQLRTSLINPGKFLPAFISGGDNSSHYPNYIWMIILLLFTISLTVKRPLFAKLFSWSILSVSGLMLTLKILTPGIPLYFPEYADSNSRIIRYGNIPPEHHGVSQSILRKNNKTNITLSSFKPVKKLSLEIDNPGTKCNTSIYLFDKKIKNVFLPAKSKVILTFAPEQRKNFKKRYFYRLNFTDYPEKNRKIYVKLL